jgi:hypothetical protein
MPCRTMKRYVVSHREGIDGLKLETDAPVPELRGPTDVSHLNRTAYFPPPPRRSRWSRVEPRCYGGELI